MRYATLVTTRATTALALLLTASACGRSSAAPPLPPPRTPEPLVSNCGPGNAPSPETLGRAVEYFRTLLLEYEDIAGPALGGAAWSAQRAAFRVRLGEAGDIPSLSRALVALEAGLAPRMPAPWRERRSTWESLLGSAPQLTTFGDGLREMIGASTKAPAFDDEQRGRVRRIYVGLSLLFDTCLAAGD
jgi:hypothetical protein